MADPLRPLRVRLADPASAGDLLAFLRRRACVVEQVGANAFDVWPPPLLHEQNGSREGLLAALGAAACFSCGVPIESGLVRLGSTRCHDCRSQTERPLTDPCDGRFRVERARVELRAYLRAWRAETGGGAAAVAE